MKEDDKSTSNTIAANITEVSNDSNHSAGSNVSFSKLIVNNDKQMIGGIAIFLNNNLHLGHLNDNF